MGFSIVSDKYLFIPRYESLANISDIGTSITQSECISSKYSFIISSISSCEKYTYLLCSVYILDASIILIDFLFLFFFKIIRDGFTAVEGNIPIGKEIIVST